MTSTNMELLKNEGSVKDLLNRINMTMPEKLSALTVAEMYLQFLSICKSEGKDQDYAAKRLKISPSRLSKYLSVINAPDFIKRFADIEKIKDIETLYLLSKIAETQPDTILKLISDWKDGKIRGGLREAANKLTSSIFKKNNEQPSEKIILTLELGRNSATLHLQLKNGINEISLNFDHTNSKPLELSIPEVNLSLTMRTIH